VTTNLASQVFSHLLSTQPFVPFNHQGAERLLKLVNRRLVAVADWIEGDSEVVVDHEMRTIAQSWSTTAGSVDVRAVLCEAFAMPTPPIDETGQFRPEWVLGHYAHRANELLPLLLTHLASLGVLWLTDTLAAITAVGEVLSCNDPVTAYVEMDAMINYVLAADAGTSRTIRRHLAQMEPAIQRARRAAARSSQLVRDVNADTEARANALADAYKRLLEGPFRQFAWALLCLMEGNWQATPTLGTLRDRLVAAGGGLAAIAEVIIPELRNAEAHETLVWDGFAEEFSTEGIQISPQDVVIKAQLAQCIIGGCEAGLSAVRFLDVPNQPSLLPDHEEQGRMPAWRRVQAFFGTNCLRLLDASLNTKHASLRVENLALGDVNPCLQALVLSRRLMPDVESFSVSALGGEVVITASAEALTACMASWEFAVSNLDRIPLATFLPANLDARMSHEEVNVAIRSAAWIAVDDAVGVIDGSAEIWDDRERALIDIRLHLIELSVGSTIDWLGAAAPRLRSVAESVASLRQWVDEQRPSKPDLADTRVEMQRLRLQWESWGPVLRHPLVFEIDKGDPDERQPQIRCPPESWAFRLL
jgi:hypothetical protein